MSDCENEDLPCDQDLSFIKAAIAFPVLFEKSITRASKLRTKKAILELQAILPGILGKQITEDQIFKKIQNLKQKVDIKFTANKKIFLSNESEQILRDVLGGQCNLSIKKVRGAISVGIEENVCADLENPAKKMCLQMNEHSKLCKKIRHTDPVFDFESENTKYLSNLELEHKVLLHQLRFAQFQNARKSELNLNCGPNLTPNQ